MGGVLVGLLVGCGGFEKSTYDIELNEDELSSVPYSCESGRTGRSTSGWSFDVRQRWTFSDGIYGGTWLEVPGYYREFIHRDTTASADVPYVLEGTTSSEGPFQFVAIDSWVEFETAAQLVLRFYVDSDSLEDDRIQGFVEMRSDSTDMMMGSDVCRSWVSFTGRKVKE
ncbi:hypothetical protein LY474_15135 [Myxococcus stipitatus]|uniref:hypothetical protein n=1 Tax=Myxococcus stipitatus TaxID=83455 RepID=UPI001F1CC492|nr:hypothetical protein [Myxococcus stipitatus]MCE9669145.1 hypothetical protein [Myxococcus stipitatus]